MAKREPRTPALPVTFRKAEEAVILAAMTTWPDRMEERLRTAGLGEDFSEAAHRMWEAKFAHELAHPGPDTVAVVTWLAEHGHASAQSALRSYATTLLEDGTAALPARLTLTTTTQSGNSVRSRIRPNVGFRKIACMSS